MKYSAFLLSVIGFTITQVLTSEVLHTINEKTSQQCNKLFDVLEEDDYAVIEETMLCEMRHNEKCVKDTTLVK